MEAIADFFEPYILFLLGAAYNIQQTLEGLDISSSNFIVRDSSGQIVTSYWSPSEATMVSFGLLLAYALLLTIFLSLAGYVLARKKGCLVVLLIVALPGIANALGFLPAINHFPDTFVISGTGILGSVMGMIPLLLLGLLTGWSLMIIANDILSLEEKFRSYYDHLWYVMAVLTGMFFVADSASLRTVETLREENQFSQKASLYLLHQTREYLEHCHDSKVAHLASCEWSSYVQVTLNEYFTQTDKVFPMFGPTSSADIYSPGWKKLTAQEILSIRKELKKL